jgi:hypothetical protein
MALRWCVAGGWRRLLNEKLRNLYVSPNTDRVIKSRRTRWEGNVTRKGEKKYIYEETTWKT